MCLLILVASIAWYVVKPDVVNAYGLSTFYGAETPNCKCANTGGCKKVSSNCDSGTWVINCDAASHNETDYCYTNSVEKCGSHEDCDGLTGGSYNCAKMDGD